MLAKLGNTVSFIGKVGDDPFGRMLRQGIVDAGIDTSHLYNDKYVNTTLAFVHTAPDGDRDFSFYRNPGADMMLTEDEIPESLFKDTKIFHFGTISMTHQGVRQATKKAVGLAKQHGCLISFDPNIRLPLWDNMDNAKEQTDFGLRHCDILKISDNEIQWYTEKEDYGEGISVLKQKYDIPIILLTLGKEGSRAYYKDIKVDAKSFPIRTTIDTTGAGDASAGCILHYLLKWGINNPTQDMLKDMLTFANAGAALITTKKGALTVMPTKEEINSICQAMLKFE